MFNRGLTLGTLRMAVVAGLLVAPVLDPTSATAQAPAPVGKVAKVGAPTEPSSLDLTSNTEAAIAATLLYNVLETLTELHPDGKITPLLAKSWTLSSDGLVYTFQLNDAKFHDGTPLTADDVVWTFTKRRDTKTDPQTADFRKMKNIVALNPKTVQITLSAPSNSFLRNISKRSGVILAQRSYGKIATNPIGTGPFKFKLWKRGESLALERFVGYWGKSPALAGVEFRYITDKNAELNSFLAGELDILSPVGVPARINEIKSNPSLKVAVGVNGVVQFLALNNSVAPLKDLRVRQAIAYAIDRDAIVQAAENNAKPSAVFATPLEPYFDSYNPYPYSPAKARQLLADAGFKKNDLKLTLIGTANDPNASLHQVLQGQLAAVGIDVTLKPVDLAVYVSQVMTHSNYQLATVGHLSEMLMRFICEPGTGTGGWYVHFCDATTSEALKKADSATDPKESIHQYQIATHRLAEQVGAITLYSWPWITATSKKVTGFPTSPINQLMDMRKVSIQP